MHNVMLDFETMATNATAAVVQIGAVKFTDEGVIVDEFRLNVSLQSEIDNGFHISGETVEWWMGQERKTWMEEPRHDSHNAFMLLNDFLSGARWVWSHSTFDAPILFYHNRILGIKQSVHFTRFLDMRTLGKLSTGRATTPARIKIDRKRILHDGLSDCLSQIEWYLDCMKHL